MNLTKLLSIGLIATMAFSCTTNEKKEEEKASGVFPHAMPEIKPNIPLSAAMDRMFDYPAPRVQDNPLYTLFKYSEIDGFDYNGGDGTISRRDPSRPILVNGKYYIYYTKRHTIVPPIGSRRAAEATDEIPSTDWDLCDIWYATSKDGFSWEEQGVAVKRPEKPTQGWRSVATPDILIWKGKYYLYYQAFSEPSGLRGDWCPVSVSVSDSPEGPFELGKANVIPNGAKGEWDQDVIHDPFPIVFNGKIYLYYKGTYNKWEDKRDKYAVAVGLAIAEDPLGPFEKNTLNPVLNSGHETCFFPYKSGVATIVTRDGNERETVQYAEDGVNFKVQSAISLPPIAGGPYTPDAFTNSGNASGIKWGVSHFTNQGQRGKGYSIIARFDCDLSTDEPDKFFKGSNVFHKSDVYFKQGLGGKKKSIKAATMVE
ncbi:glycoside hydrolase family 117 protein [Saccharicrinis aurantiacus]|uniref:glycoside hydrolase family 117 protein n=1 Tax=Saccharicrinis aurantiacus TaxID=1849719 RepID=UPI002490BE06|nr:hypothetical protein [Saccharicrinis aurantiacus]